MTPQLHVLLAAYDEAEVLSDGPRSHEEASIREMRVLLDARPRQSPDLSVLDAVCAAADSRPEEPGLRAERPPVRPRRSWRIARRMVGVLAACSALVWVSTAGWQLIPSTATETHPVPEQTETAHQHALETVALLEPQQMAVQTVRAAVVPARLPEVDKALAWEQEAQREELAQARIRAQQIEMRLDSLLWGEPVRTLSLEATGDLHHALVPARAGTP